MLASTNDYDKSLCVLLQSNANVNARDSYGDTALICAARAGNNKCVAQLVALVPESRGSAVLVRRAKLNIVNNNKETALIVAARLGHDPCVKLLIYDKDVLDMQDKWGNTALIVACEYGHAACVRILIGADVNLNLKNKQNYDAEAVASRCGKTVCKELVAAKLKQNAISTSAVVNMTTSRYQVTVDTDSDTDAVSPLLDETQL